MRTLDAVIQFLFWKCYLLEACATSLHATEINLFSYFDSVAVTALTVLTGSGKATTQWEERMHKTFLYYAAGTIKSVKWCQCQEKMSEIECCSQTNQMNRFSPSQYSFSVYDLMILWFYDFMEGQWGCNCSTVNSFFHRVEETA